MRDLPRSEGILPRDGIDVAVESRASPRDFLVSSITRNVCTELTCIYYVATRA
ncbi:hypothetical protein X777_13166 [Ooceraea biroi]|uniref:Uncharacterized protein n=1 Tax=Ooceraea biroi TaxID=2015173 RepID=A0A026VYZ2_OOCBI|nr:hypothetical protein X777_13166 [Ooceraea biroi]